MIGYARDFFRVMRLPCKGQSELMSREVDGAVSGGERAGLRAHRLMCRGCRGLARQLRWMRARLSEIGRQVEAGKGLPEDVRVRLAARIEESGENL